jgi:uncharacterized membrane protein
MNKEQFLTQLKRALEGMPESEKREVLYDYEEHFRMGAAEGKSEEQIAQSLGNPRTIGGSYRIDAILEGPKESGGVPAKSVLRAVFASLSLTLFNVIVVLGPFAGLVGALIGLWAGACSVALSGAAVVLGAIVAIAAPGLIPGVGLNPAFLLFAGIGVTALGVLAVIGMGKLSKIFTLLVARYVRFNARIVTRRK